MLHLRFVQDAYSADDACNAARDKGTAGEAEQEYFVSWRVVVAEEAVTGPDAVGEPDSGTAADNAVEDVPSSDALVVVDDL
jgi:hypothetical protein